jgi:hypothetical protein
MRDVCALAKGVNSLSTSQAREDRRSFHMRRLGCWPLAIFLRPRQTLKVAGSAACSHTWGMQPSGFPEQWLQTHGGTAGTRIQKSAY